MLVEGKKCSFQKVGVCMKSTDKSQRNTLTYYLLYHLKPVQINSMFLYYFLIFSLNHIYFLPISDIVFILKHKGEAPYILSSFEGKKSLGEGMADIM